MLVLYVPANGNNSLALAKLERCCADAGRCVSLLTIAEVAQDEWKVRCLFHFCLLRRYGTCGTLYSTAKVGCNKKLGPISFDTPTGERYKELTESNHSPDLVEVCL